jgi:hypothetical protein
MRDRAKLAAGQLRRHVRLGTEAVYRVHNWDELTVRVEVVRAPGLRAGQEIRLDYRAVLEMPVVAEER